jgi:plastocyanin
MKQSHFALIVVLILLVVAMPGRVVGGGNAVFVATPAPVHITLESWAPYYQPHMAVVSAGTPVGWVNPTASPHSIRHDGCLTEGPCLFSSITIPPDSSFVIAPLPPGQYAYHCELHPIMRGTLIVVDPSTR